MNNSFKHLIGRGPFNQRGLTLIEMGIAMTVAMFLLVGITTVLMGIRTSSGTQTGLAQLQDNERLAMTILTDVIQQAGYFPDPIHNTAATVLPVSTNFAAAAQAITGTYSATAPGDTITARYAMRSTDGIFNCVGATTTSATAVAYESQFSVANNALQCLPTVAGAAGTATPLVSGVTNMSILYGVTTTSGATNCAGTDSYLTAAQVTAITAVNAWFNICSVKVTLTFTNPTPGANPVKFTRVIPIMVTAGP